MSPTSFFEKCNLFRKTRKSQNWFIILMFVFFTRLKIFFNKIKADELKFLSIIWIVKTAYEEKLIKLFEKGTIFFSVSSARREHFWKKKIKEGMTIY